MRLAVRLSSVAILALGFVGLVEACTGDDPVLSSPSPGVDSGGSDADPAIDAAQSDGGTDSGDGGGGDAGYALTTGDIVVLGPAGIDVDGTGFVTQWRNSVAGSPLAAAITTTSTKPTKVLAGDGGAPCVGFTQAELMQMPDVNGALKPLGDFSVTAVLSSTQGAYQEFSQVPVARTATTDTGPQHDSYVGWALHAWYQTVDRADSNEPKFAGRLSYALGTSALEVVATLPNVNDTIYGVAMFRRGSDLYLAVGNKIYGPTAGASSVAQPDGKPLLLGKSDDDSDFGGTAFKGRLCAVVVHHGPETEIAILQRIAALRTPF